LESIGNPDGKLQRWLLLAPPSADVRSPQRRRYSASTSSSASFAGRGDGQDPNTRTHALLGHGLQHKRRPNREALRLYRDILRACQLFDFPGPNGEPWGSVLARSARLEFETARHETDPEMVARMLVVGQDALMQVQEKARGSSCVGGVVCVLQHRRRRALRIGVGVTENQQSERRM
jgi:hypothetical protein